MSEQMQIGWAILELMGHRKLAGFVTDENGLLRIDVYDGPQRSRCEACAGRGGVDGEACGECGGECWVGVRPLATQWYGRQAVYCITASTEALCVELTQSHRPAPVGRWELPQRTSDELRTGHEDEADLLEDVELDDEEVPY